MTAGERLGHSASRLVLLIRSRVDGKNIHGNGVPRVGHNGQELTSDYAHRPCILALDSITRPMLLMWDHLHYTARRDFL